MKGLCVRCGNPTDNLLAVKVRDGYETAYICSGCLAKRGIKSARITGIGEVTMKYLVSKEDLVAIKTGEKRVDEIATSENIALMTWSGGDIRCEVGEDGGYELIASLNDLIEEIAKLAQNAACRECLMILLSEAKARGFIKEREE